MAEGTIFNINYFQQLFAACLDITFVVCSKAYPKWSPAKDVFSQIFPTAVVLKSVYWPFYRDSNNNCLCICEKFGIVCRHITPFDGVHCLDMTVSSRYQDDSFFLTPGAIKPVKYKITYMPTLPTLPRGYLVTAQIFVNGYTNNNLATHSRRRRRQLPGYFHINERFVFVQQQSSITTGYVFCKCIGLKESLDEILHLKSETVFPEKLITTYKLEAEEISIWTASASTTQMIMTKSHVKEIPPQETDENANIKKIENPAMKFVYAIKYPDPDREKLLLKKQILEAANAVLMEKLDELRKIFDDSKL